MEEEERDGDSIRKGSQVLGSEAAPAGLYEGLSKQLRPEAD